MPEAEKNTFILTLRGTTSDGKPITPGTISVGLLANFTENFRNFIQNDTSQVAIEEGSFKIVVFMTAVALSTLNADLENIGQGNYNAVSSPKGYKLLRIFKNKQKNIMLKLILLYMKMPHC